MKKLVIAAAFFAATLATQTSSAAVYTEVSDAGQTLGTTQTVAGGTTAIAGSLSGDAADVYKFGWNGGTFQASTSSTFDAMLFLFDGTGQRLAFNDDSFGSLQSFLSATIAPGAYLLGISRYPVNYNGNLSGFNNLSGSTGTYTIAVSETSAVPEPSAIALLGLGLFGLAMSRRRKAA